MYYILLKYYIQTNESTALHLAAEGGHREVVEVLLESGADPKDENGVCLFYLEVMEKELKG